MYVRIAECKLLCQNRCLILNGKPYGDFTLEIITYIASRMGLHMHIGIVLPNKWDLFVGC